MVICDLPTELILEIAESLHDRLLDILRIASTCRFLRAILWPIYKDMQSNIIAAHISLLRISNALELTALMDSDDDDQDEDDEDDKDEEDDEAEGFQCVPGRSTDDDAWSGVRGALYNGASPFPLEIWNRHSWITTPPTQVHPDNFFEIPYSRVTMHLDTPDRELCYALRSFVLRVPQMDNLILHLGPRTHLEELAKILRASSQIPALSLTVKWLSDMGGNMIMGHGDLTSGPYNPLPTTSRDKRQIAMAAPYAFERPRTVEVSCDVLPQISALTIQTDVMFLASLYPLTLQILVLAPITSLTLEGISLDQFNWSQILPRLTMHYLEDFSLVRIASISCHDLFKFLRRHGSITTLNLAYTEAADMTRQALHQFDLPSLHSLRGDPSYLRPLLQHHANGHLRALQNVSVTFPRRMSMILKYIPDNMPPELDDPSFHDMDEFHAVYSSLMRSCPGLRVLELENLRYNGFVEWVISASSGKWSAPSSVQEVVIIDEKLAIRRGTILPLSRWMEKNGTSWVNSGQISKFTRPSDVAVQEMLQAFFGELFPNLQSLEYESIST